MTGSIPTVKVDLDGLAELEDAAQRAAVMFPYRMGIKAGIVLSLIAEVRASRAELEALRIRVGVISKRMTMDQRAAANREFSAELQAAGIGPDWVARAQSRMSDDGGDS